MLAFVLFLPPAFLPEVLSAVLTVSATLTEAVIAVCFQDAFCVLLVLHLLFLLALQVSVLLLLFPEVFLNLYVLIQI